ncbi:MAG TPA: lysophospholipid acyltransferase family protein [Bacteroidia bacterium]|nr:lysophospholipid acyltransferase family protein [Bacteroidia bacterium]
MLYYITYSCIYLLSLLPLPVLYFISDVFAFILYYIIRYRRDVVRKNLLNSFPEKKLSEIIQIEKKFYRFFVQWIVETLKLCSISKNELAKRCQFSDSFKEIFQKNYSQNKNIVALMGHFGNWEWAGAAFNLYFPQKLYVVYHPLSNKTFDKIMKKIRSRMGTQLLPMNAAPKFMLSQQHQSNVFAFIADQSPSLQNSFWTKFLNQYTAVYYGPEKITQKINAIPVTVIVYPVKYKKGYYFIDAKKIQINEKIEYPIMTQFMKDLEQSIKEYPEFWLWSHKRWKLSKEKI